jgi:hypothetical protein
VIARRSQWRGAIAGAVLVAVTAALIPVPVWAADGNPSPNVTPIRASMHDAVAREVARSPALRSARRAQQNTSSTESGGFFKSGPGIAALVVMAAGAGYAIYSASHDRIHSPAKK